MSKLWLYVRLCTGVIFSCMYGCVGSFNPIMQWEAKNTQKEFNVHPYLVNEAITQARFAHSILPLVTLSARQSNNTDVECSTISFLGHPQIC